MQYFFWSLANYTVRAELVIVTGAFLSIEYKTAEILAMQARKDFLMLSYWKAKSKFVSDRRKISFTSVQSFLPTWASHLCYRWNKKQTLSKRTTKNKRNGSFRLNQSRRTRDERADPNASQGRFNNSNNNNNKIHNLKLGVHGSAETIQQWIAVVESWGNIGINWNLSDKIGQFRILTVGLDLTWNGG